MDQASAVSSALSFNQCEGRRLPVRSNIRGDLSCSYTGSPVQIPRTSFPIFSSGPPSLSPSLLHGWTHSRVHCSMRWVSQAGPELLLYVPGILSQETENTEINVQSDKGSTNLTTKINSWNSLIQALSSFLRDSIPPPTYPPCASDVQAWWRGSSPQLLPLPVAIADSECNMNYMDFGALCSQPIPDPGSATF